MSALDTIVASSEIFAVFLLCLGTSLGIAYWFLRLAINLTTGAGEGHFRPAGLVSRRLLGAFWLRSQREVQK